MRSHELACSLKRLMQFLTLSEQLAGFLQCLVSKTEEVKVGNLEVSAFLEVEFSLGKWPTLKKDRGAAA